MNYNYKLLIETSDLLTPAGKAQLRKFMVGFIDDNAAIRHVQNCASKCVIDGITVWASWLTDLSEPHVAHEQVMSEIDPEFLAWAKSVQPHALN